MKSPKRQVILSFGVLVMAMLACQAVPGLGGAAPTAAPTNVLYQDDFEDTDSGWFSLRDDEGITDYDQGGYRIKVDKENWFFWVEAGQAFTDVQVDADARKIGGPDVNEFGLVCRYTDENNFYFFTISSDGYYGVTKLIDGEYEFIGMSEMQQSSAVRQGGEQNHLQAVCEGNSLKFSVNGTVVADVTDDSFSSGDVGFIAGTEDTPGADILFDNLVVSRP